jgi:hypothetical protein
MSDHSENGIGRLEDLIIDLGAEVKGLGAESELKGLGAEVKGLGSEVRKGFSEVGARLDAQDRILRHVVETLPHKEDKK